jgi:hypothetical protein
MNKVKVFIKNFWNKFFQPVKKVYLAADQAFIKLVGQNQAITFKQEALGILKSDLGKIALSVVAGIKVVGSNLSDTEKRQEALTQILALAKVQGVTASESIVNLFIELAVTALKNKI